VLEIVDGDSKWVLGSVGNGGGRGATREVVVDRQGAVEGKEG